MVTFPFSFGKVVRDKKGANLSKWLKIGILLRFSSFFTQALNMLQQLTLLILMYIFIWYQAIPFTCLSVFEIFMLVLSYCCSDKKNIDH